MNVLTCRAWTSVYSTWLWITAVLCRTRSGLLPTEIRPEVLSWDQREPVARKGWPSQMVGGRGEDGRWQVSRDVVKEGIREEPGEESADSRVCPLNLKFSVFRRKQGGFYVWTWTYTASGCKAKNGVELISEWYTYPKHYSVIFCGFLPFPCPYCCFRWSVLAQQRIAWWQNPYLAMRTSLNLEHCSLLEDNPLRSL